MRPRLQQTPRTKVQTKVSRKLIYGASGIAIIGLLIAGWLFFFQFGDQETMLAGGAGPSPINDDRSSAVWLGDLYEFESNQAAYTNVDANSDAGGSCFSSVEQGVWFKFKALYASGTVTIKTGGAEGSAQYLEVAVENSAGTEVACSTAAGANDDVTLSLSGLTVDEWYYILIDTRNPADEGTFTVYINNVSPVKFYSRDKGDWHKTKTWSTSGYNGPKASSTPGKANVVFIKGINGEIKVKGDEECAGLFIESDNQDAELRLQPNRRLSVYGRFEINNYSHKSVKLEAKSNSVLYVQADWHIQKHNGWQDLEIELEGDSVIVDGSLLVHHSNGKGIEFELKKSVLSVAKDVEFLQSGGYGGNEYKIEEDLYIGGDWYITKTNGSGNREIELKKNRTFTVQGDIIAEKTGGSGKEEITIEEGTLSVSGNVEMLSNGGSGNYEVEFKKVDASVGGHLYFNKENGSNKYTVSLEDNSTLTVGGDMTHRYQNGSQNYELDIKKEVTLTIGGDYFIEKNGGSNKLQFEAKDNVTIDVDGDVTILHTSGSSGMELDFDDHTTLSMDGNLAMEWTGGSNPMDFTFGDGSGSHDDTLRVGGYFHFGATTGWSGSYRLDATFNRSAITFIGGNIAAVHAHGRLLFNNNDSKLVLNGSSQQQIQGESTGSLYVGYRHLEVDNSYTHADSSMMYGVELMGPIELESELRLTHGTVRTTYANMVRVASGADVEGGSTAAYVDGPMEVEGNNSLFFPVGRYNFYAPIEIHNQAPNSSGNAYRAAYFPEGYIDTATGPVLHHVSRNEHWELDRIAGTADVEYELYWYDHVWSGISDLADLTIALYDSTSAQWENVGGTSVNGTLEEGSIRSNSRQGQFGPATFGSVGGGNILPIELAYFTAHLNDRSTVDLEWQTHIEINNDYFTLERSADGRNFEPIGEVMGAGNSDQPLDYYFEDRNPLPGQNLYRLKQTDYNGEFEYFPVVLVQVPVEADAVLQVYQAAPNPFSAQTSIQFTALRDAPVQVIVQQASGQVVHQEVVEAREGTNTYTLSGDRLRAGMYIVTLQQGNWQSEGYKLVKAQ